MTIKLLKFLNDSKGIIAVLIILLLIIYSLWGRSKKTDVLQPSYTSTSIIGKTQNDLQRQLGGPVNQLADPRGNIVEYKSTSETRNHQAVLKDDKVVFFKEVVTLSDNKDFLSLKQKYGDPEQILYGEQAISGNYLFPYPSEGVAFLANSVTNTVREVWYFDPTDLNTFQKTWVIGYTTEIQPRF